jgi:SSS family solute:Na+ symporter
MNIFWLIAIITTYLAVLAYLGYRGFNDTKNSSDYLIGGRSIHP